MEQLIQILLLLNLISLNKYSVYITGDESEEDLLFTLQESMDRYTEKNHDVSTQLIHTEGSNKVVVKILKLNEHSN